MNIIDNMQMERMIALLTDFGIQDNYVGVMKGVILSINPNVKIIDITHNIQPQNIKQAAFILLNSYSYFPKGTIFVVVVDPGVGSSRKPLCVNTKNYCFIAPDNGVLSYILRKVQPLQIVELSNKSFHNNNISNTFHGRDIFVPVAAHLSFDLDIEKFGAKLDFEDLTTFEPPYLKITEKQIVGEVIYHDNFGNLITSIHGDKIENKTIKNIQIGNSIIDRLNKTYTDVEIGELIAYIGSNGYLEIGIRNGNAKNFFKSIDKIYINYQ